MPLSKLLEKELFTHYKIKKIKHPIFLIFPTVVLFEIGKGYPWTENDELGKNYIKKAM